MNEKPTRKELLRFIKQSRAASKKLAALVNDENCRVEDVQDLLDKGALVEDAWTEVSEKNASYNKKKIPAIVPVIKHDRDDIVRVLYLAPAIDPELKDGWLGSCLANGSIKSAMALVELGDLNRGEEHCADLLQHASMRGLDTIVAAFLEHGVDPNIRINKNDTVRDRSSVALHWAASKEVTQILIDAGANINEKDEMGLPPVYNLLHRASMSSRTDANKGINTLRSAILLIELGAELSGKDEATDRDWDILGTMNQMKVDCSEVVAALKAMADFDAKEWIGRVRSLHLLEALIECYPEMDAGSWASKAIWQHYWFGSEDTFQTVERLLEKGVKPPKIQHLQEDYIRGWLEFGIPVSENDLEVARNKFYEQETEGYEEEWKELEEGVVVESNCKALERVARIQRKETFPDLGETKSKTFLPKI